MYFLVKQWDWAMSKIDQYIKPAIDYSTQIEQYDVLIVGAGMVGLSVALSIQSKLKAVSDPSLKIGLVASDISSKPYQKAENIDNYDTRVSAINEKNKNFLTDIGAWQYINEQAISSYTEMKVWDGEGTGFVHFSANQLHVPELGSIVENSVLMHALHEAIDDNNQSVQAPNVTMIQDTVKSIDTLVANQFTPVELASGITVHSKLLVAADGALSNIKQWMEVGQRNWAYHQNAIVATIQTQGSHQNTAWQRFREQGPLAILPLSHPSLNMSSIVWSTTEEESQNLLALSDQAFCKMLTEESEQCLGEVISVSRRMMFPLVQRHAKRYVVPGIALVGDAAHTIHPLAGQGVNLGFYDASVLADEIIRAKNKFIWIGDQQILNRYQRRRQGDNLLSRHEPI
jgi:2-octaprenylphenol hydroxylase